MKARRGFTLWEMGLVLIIMGIASLIAIPAFTRLGVNLLCFGVNVEIDDIGGSG